MNWGNLKSKMPTARNRPKSLLLIVLVSIYNQKWFFIWVGGWLLPSLPKVSGCEHPFWWRKIQILYRTRFNVSKKPKTPVTCLGLLTTVMQFSTAARELIVRILKLCQRIKNKKGSEKWGRIVSFWQNRLASSGQAEIFIYSYLCVHLYVCKCVRKQNSWRNWNIAEIPVRKAMHFANKITHFPFTPAVTFPAVAWKPDDLEKQEAWCWIQPWLSKSRIMLSSYREWVQIYTQGLRTDSSLKRLIPASSVSCCFPEADGCCAQRFLSSSERK